MASRVPSKRSATPAQIDPLGEIDDISNSLGYAIKRAKVRTYEMLFQILGPDVISPARLTALNIVCRHPGINQSELAEELRITRASVVKVVDTLESLGFVERQAIPDDRRSYALVATEQGKHELRGLSQRLKAYEQAISANLTAEERVQLMALLAKVAVT